MPEALPEPDPIRPATVARRAPVLWVAAAVLLGYIFAEIQPNASPKILAGMALVFGVVALLVGWRAPLTGFRERKISAVWGAAFLIAGTLLAWAWHEVREPAPAVAWATLPPREATLTLRVTRSFSMKADTDYVGGLAEIVSAPTILVDLPGRNILYRVRVYPGETPPARGATVEVTGVLSYLPDLAMEPIGAATEEQRLAVANAARFRAYVHSQGAWFELARGRRVRDVAPPTAWQSWLAEQHAKIESLLRHGPEALEESYGNGYTALLLGEPALLATTQRDAFTISGGIYLFAVSGLHVGVLAAALWWALRRVPRLPHGASDVLILLIVWLYAETAGGTPSARRIALMFTFYLLARWFGRARSPLAAWVAAGVATLIVDPLVLDNAGFELSFGVVLGLILYAPLLRSAVEAKWAPWRDIPAASLAPWQKCVAWLWRVFLDLTATSWTAVLSSAALTAQFFGGFSMYLLVLNFVFFPLTCVALWAGTVAVAMGLAGFPPLTWIDWLANAAGLAAFGLMSVIAKALPSWPWLYVHLQVAPVRAGSLATLAVLAAMLLAQPKNRAPRWWYFALPVAILAVFAIFAVRLA